MAVPTMSGYTHRTVEATGPRGMAHPRHPALSVSLRPLGPSVRALCMACRALGGVGQGAMQDAPRAALIRWLRGCIIARLLAEAGDIVGCGLGHDRLLRGPYNQRPLGPWARPAATRPGSGGEAEKRRKERTRKRLDVVMLLVVLSSGVMGCANMTPRQQRALSSGAIGAAGGSPSAPLSAAARRLARRSGARPARRPGL